MRESADSAPGNLPVTRRFPRNSAYVYGMIAHYISNCS